MAFKRTSQQIRSQTYFLNKGFHTDPKTIVSSFFDTLKSCDKTGAVRLMGSGLPEGVDRGNALFYLIRRAGALLRDIPRRHGCRNNSD